MACNPEVLKRVPLFALLDEEETAVLAGQVEMKEFAPRQRIYKTGEPGGRGFVVVSGAVRVQTMDEDQQEVIVDRPVPGEFFGFASMLEGTPHQTDAVAVEQTVCIEIDRHDIAVLLERKPLAGMDMLAVLSRQFHTSQQLVKRRSARHPNDVIEKGSSFGERLADSVARFGGSWAFILTFAALAAAYVWLNVHIGSSAWDPYHPPEPVPFHDRRAPGAGHHDEPEPAGYERSPARRTRLRRKLPGGGGNPGSGKQAQSAGGKDRRRRGIASAKTPLTPVPLRIRPAH